MRVVQQLRELQVLVASVGLEEMVVFLELQLREELVAPVVQREQAVFYI
jgi:hypothetical protein